MKRLTSRIAILLMLCHLGLPSRAVLIAQPVQTKTRDEYAAKLSFFEQFVKDQMEKDRIPGLTIGFSKDDYTWVKGFGYVDLENKVPAIADSSYRLASVTKTMTGTAIVQLVERGKIKLDEEIQTYVPSYPKQKWPVTVQQLLVHLGGGQTGSGIGPDLVTPREVVARIAKYPIQNEPGAKFDYQTSGYNLLGAAIEEVSGKSFGECLGDLYLKQGRREQALESYKKALEIDPNFEHAKEMLKKQTE